MTGAVTGEGYLDSASAAPLHPAAREVLLAALDQGYADPRRLHRAGRDGAPAARQRAGGHRGRARRTPRRGHLHAQRHPRGAPRAAGAGARLAAWRRRGATRPSSTPRCATPSRGAPGPTRWASHVTGRVRVGDLVDAAAAQEVGVVALQSANHEVGTVQDVGRLELPDDVPLFTDACCIDGPTAAAGRLGRGRRVGAQVGWSGGRRRPAGAQARPLAQPLPRRRPGRRALDRLRERPGRARRSRSPAGGGGRARRGQRPPARARRRRTPSRGGGGARRRGRRRPRPATPPPGDLLLPLRRRRGAGDRARPAAASASPADRPAPHRP